MNTQHPMPFRFDGKNIWVTGAYQGIGRAVAEIFVSLGGKVTGFDKQFRTEDAEAPSFRTIHMDLRDPHSIQRAFQCARGKSERIDVLVHAAGVIHTGTIEQQTNEEWDHMFAVNVTGPFQFLRAITPVMKDQRNGAIITIGSNAAHTPRTHMPGYGASKAALTSLTHSLALELALFGVRCNVISPGSTNTPMQRGLWQNPEDRAKVVTGTPEQYRLGIPLGKIAEPQDIAWLAAFLASDLANHIVLQDIVVDGGATLGA